MSLFGAMMGDLDEDPFFGGQIRRMNQMMNSMFRDPFGDMFSERMFASPLMLPGPQHQQVQPHRQRQHADFGPGAMMPFSAFPNLRHVFDMSNAGGGAQFSSMQVMSMTQGPDGRPQVYQASSSTRQGPNGVRETKKTVADSRTGLKKMSVGHHIHDRSHIVEREQNVYSGEQEERQEFINLDEEEADTFNKEWMEKTRGMRRNDAIGYGNRQRHSGRDRNSDMLALPPAQSSSSSSGRVPPRAMPRRRVQSSSTEPKSKAATIAQNKSDEKGKKRPVIVEIDSDTEEPQTKHPRRSSEDEVTITEVTSDSDDDAPQN